MTLRTQPTSVCALICSYDTIQQQQKNSKDSSKTIPRKEKKKRETVPQAKLEGASCQVDDVSNQRSQGHLSRANRQYLRSSGLHDKRIEALLLKYLGPSSSEDSKRIVHPGSHAEEILDNC